MSIANNQVKDNSEKTSKDRTRCFVIQPFGTKKNVRTDLIVDNNKVYEALRKLGTIRPDYPIKVYRADVEKYAKALIHAHVVDCINKSDFCVCDFTGQNPNVLYETGIARGLCLPIVIISQDREDIPTDLKPFITVIYKMDELDNLAEDIERHFDMIVAGVGESKALKYSRVTYFGNREDSQIRDRIRQVTDSFDILQTNLATLQTDYLSDIIETMKKNPRLKLRILTLNPQSIFVNFRGQQLGYGENIALYRGELDAVLRGVHFSLRQFGERVQIRIYDDFPTQIVYYFDNEALVCVVSATGRSRENCAFLLNDKMPGVKKSFVDHFEYLWDKKSSEPM